MIKLLNFSANKLKAELSPFQEDFYISCLPFCQGSYIITVFYNVLIKIRYKYLKVYYHFASLTLLLILFWEDFCLLGDLFF